MACVYKYVRVGSKRGVSWGSVPGPSVVSAVPGGAEAEAARERCRPFAYVGLWLCSLPSAKKGRGQQESRWRWLKAAFLLSSAAAGGLLLWSSLSAEEGVTEVLAHRGESLQDKFVEVPCSEDYDSHKRFEGIWTGLSEGGWSSLQGTAESAEPHLYCRTPVFLANTWVYGLNPQMFMPLGPAQELLQRRGFSVIPI